ncbi:MAG: DUF1820 family protein [Oligoflexia bacterium]|nr:DUF1820 family protein [Oligoflexia bacterium]
MPIPNNNNQPCYYVVSYRDPQTNKILSLKAKTIRDSNVGLSFIFLSDFIFDTDSLVINPVAEELKNRFSNTKGLHLSIYNIISIEETGVENKGLKFEQDRLKVLILPSDNTTTTPH